MPCSCLWVTFSIEYPEEKTEERSERDFSIALADRFSLRDQYSNLLISFGIGVESYQLFLLIHPQEVVIN